MSISNMASEPPSPIALAEDGQLFSLAAPPSPRQHSLEQLATIGEMAVSLVHELRNPLTTILLGLNACQRYELPEAAQLRLSIALDEAQRLQRLVDSILACARPYACPIDPSQPALYLQTLLREIALIVALTPAFSQRRIEFNLPDDLICVRGDRDKLKQVFLNLLENACQAVAAGEKITWSVELADDRERVWIRLHNDGAIPPDILPHLSQPFFTTKPNGNGLGLAIAQQILEACGGQLVIESTLAAGTTVSVGLLVTGC